MRSCVLGEAELLRTHSPQRSDAPLGPRGWLPALLRSVRCYAMATLSCSCLQALRSRRSLRRFAVRTAKLHSTSDMMSTAEVQTTRLYTKTLDLQLNMAWCEDCRTSVCPACFALMAAENITLLSTRARGLTRSDWHGLGESQHPQDFAVTSASLSAPDTCCPDGPTTSGGAT